jgi:hypothetical protein
MMSPPKGKGGGIPLIPEDAAKRKVKVKDERDKPPAGT